MADGWCYFLYLIIYMCVAFDYSVLCSCIVTGIDLLNSDIVCLCCSCLNALLNIT